MSGFEFLFSLFGLLLGLSLAEVLGGFGKALKARARIRIGWLTPLLGLLVMLDLIGFWITAWSVREAIPVNYLTLMLLFVVTALYYLAANLVFPEEPDRCPDFDIHFWANKRLVVAAVLALNLPAYAADLILGRGVYFEDAFLLATQVLFVVLLITSIVARSSRLNLWLLIALVSLYPIAAIESALGG